MLQVAVPVRRSRMEPDRDPRASGQVPGRGRAAPTALCINMHNYWVGVAADVWRSGDKSLEWILKDAAAGEVRNDHARAHRHERA